MKEFRKCIPIKKYRCDLKHDRRIKVLQFKRSMSPLQVKNVIQRGFSHITFSSFFFLETTSNNLSIARNQQIDGAAVIDRRGALYLCEDDAGIPGTSGINQTCAASRIEAESDSDSDIPAISLTRDPVISMHI